jgi:hypothetical protein
MHAWLTCVIEKRVEKLTMGFWCSRNYLIGRDSSESGFKTLHDMVIGAHKSYFNSRSLELGYGRYVFKINVARSKASSIKKK